MGSTDTLRELLLGSRAWLLDRVLGYAKEHGYSRYAATQLKAWEISIVGLTDSIVGALDDYGTIPEFGVDDFTNDTPIVAFGRQEVRRHRARGVTYPMFMGLVKYYRQSFLDLVRRDGLAPVTEAECLALVGRFFDLFEIGCGVEWTSLGNTERVEELQKLNRLMVNEKNKYYTIFESLYDPVILVDADLCIEGMNDAAMESFYDQGQRDTFSYYRPPVTEVFPWLAGDLTRFAGGREQEVVFETSIPTPLGARAFEVKMKQMLDATEKFRGTVVILNDLTERKEKEEALVLNEAIRRWVSTLVDLGHRVSKMDEAEDILPMVVEAAHGLLDPEVTALLMWDAEARGFRTRSAVPETTGRRRALYPYPPSHGSGCAGSACACLDAIACRAYRDLRPVSADAGTPGADESTPRITHEHCLSVPLVMDGETVGLLLAGRPDAFGRSAAVVLESLANQAIIAVEHSEMAQRMRSLAVLDERTRIAREMHDGLAQILGFLNLEMQSLEVLVRKNRIEETVAELRNARARILEAHAEVRENILSLRTTLAGDAGPITALRTYLRELGAQTGMNVGVEAREGDDVRLSSMAAVQLVRIVQGALVNVRRHAQAANVSVRFDQEDGHLAVTVEDDGVGFDVSAVRSDIGLQSMRERAESVGGAIEIDSAPGRGTRVRLRVPLEVDTQEGDPPGTTEARPRRGRAGLEVSVAATAGRGGTAL